MKKPNPEAALLRRELDDMLKKWRRSSGVTPRLGWIRTIREGLEMNAGELALRMNISQNAVSALEKSEAKKTVQLKTLQRAAKALDCQLVYALVPRRTLEKTIEKRRARIAIADLRTLTNGILGPEYRDLIKTYGQTVKRSRLWK
jgi:predicted DNA-binding mobile mystery protein A